MRRLLKKSTVYAALSLASWVFPWTASAAEPGPKPERTAVRPIPSDRDPEIEALFIQPAQGVAPLAPNDPLRPAPPPSQSAPPLQNTESLLGPPTLAGLAGGRGRARTLSRGRATAPY
ncbi:MAG: hypothetical protein JSS02_35460, partial [Planctomycetes bacterium]|nr:hypothetical protein [Planctomycetota bacterium]